MSSCACDKVSELISGANRKLQKASRTDLIPNQPHGSEFERKVLAEEIVSITQTLAFFNKQLN